MDRNSFIEKYVVAFLATRAERFYESCSTIRNADYSWSRKQPVNDAMELAEAAWDSLKKLVVPSTPATTGSVDTVIDETV